MPGGMFQEYVGVPLDVYHFPKFPPSFLPRNVRNLWSDGVSCRNGEINGFCTAAQTP